MSPLDYALDYGVFLAWGASVFAVSLPFPILVWHLRHGIFGDLSRLETAACVVLGIISSALIAVAFGIHVGESGWPRPKPEPVTILTAWTFCGAHLIMLIRYWKQVTRSSGAALAALMAGYLPAMAAVLLTFFGDWQIGAFVVLVACLCYTAMILMTVARLSSQAAHPKNE